MSAVTVNTPYPTFTDIDGQPLEDGYVWIGVSGLEPQANPQTAYWDAALTQVVTQPVRTRGGYPLNGTAIGRLYTANAYSIKVQNKNSSTIVLDLTGAAGTGVGSISFGTTGLTPAVATDGDVVVAGTLAVANGGTGVTTSTGTGSVVLSASPTVTGPTVSSGNLAFSGTAQRITGDMSNATQSNRLAFQTSTTNGSTIVNAITNGAGVTSAFQANAGADISNPVSFTRILVNATESRVEAGITNVSGTYLPMTFYTGGSERVRVDTSGNVGIGTASPSQKLTVAATTNQLSLTTGTNELIARASSTEVALYTFQTIPMVFYTNNTERMRIDSSGNVGIGTASPSGKLDVLAAANQRLLVTERGTGALVLDAVNAANSAYQLLLVNGSQVVVQTGATERMRIDSSGNVGIGTASPGTVLHTVRTSAGAATVGAFIQNSDNTTSTEVRLAFAANSALLSSDRYGWIGYVNTGGTNGGALTFATTPGGAAATERLRIDSSGNVNITTLGARITADFSNATLTNRVAFQTNTANSATSVTALPNGSSTDSNFTVSANSDPTNASVGQLRASSSAVVVASTRTGSGTFLPLQFQTSGAVAMTINTGGNVVQGISALSTTATDGFLWITSCAGVPTGAPTAPYTNAAALICDTTNNRLYVRVAGTWRYATLT